MSMGKTRLAFALCVGIASGAGAQSAEPLGDALQRKSPAFGDSLISTIDAWRAPQSATAPFDAEENLFLSAAAAPGRALGSTATPQTLAHLYLDRALSNSESLAEACAFLDERGEAGREAKARLLALKPAAVPPPPPAASAPSAGLAAARASVTSLRNADWTQARPLFDGGAPQGGAVPAVAPAGAARTGLLPAARAVPPAKAPAAGADAGEGKPPAGVVRLVSVSMEKLQEIALDKDPGERKVQLEKPFGLGAGPLNGAGVFTSKNLTPEEIEADPVKKAVAARAARDGVPVDFQRTNAKVQLFGTVMLPIDIPGNPGELNLGLRKGGIVEIVQTRPVRRGETRSDRQAFLWPLTVEHLKKVMKVGEDFTLTGRIEGSGAVVGGIGQGVDFPYYGGVNVKAEAQVGAAHDGWISLHVSKIDEDHVRIALQEGDGTALRAHFELSAGLDLNSDDFIPHVPPSNLDESLVGKAVVLGEDASLFTKVEDLGKAELTAEFRRSKHDLRTEGWASVSLSDPATVAALDQFFKVHPKALRALPPDATQSADLGAGRLNAEVRDVTRDHEFEAHLSFLHITKSAGSTYYEVRWREDDGKIVRKLVVVGESEFEENINKTGRSQESVMWFDLDTGEASISVKLGPQERKLTTTRERVNDVIAMQKAFGLTLDGTAKIDEPHPYLQFFGLGNYGRTSEDGQFVLHNEGIEALKKADRDGLSIAYLRADWLFEKESFAPGRTLVSERAAPAWAGTADRDALRPVLDFLRANSANVNQPGGKSGSSEYSALQSQYARLAPGRSLRGDVWRLRSADAYAGDVRRMQDSKDPAQLLKLFLKFRRDGAVELKRSVVATASLAGKRVEDGREVPNVDAYIEMTGKRVTLEPQASPVKIPDSPVDEIQDVLKSWQ